jgi:hypothetical protein
MAHIRPSWSDNNCTHSLGADGSHKDQLGSNKKTKEVKTKMAKKSRGGRMTAAKSRAKKSAGGRGPVKGRKAGKKIMKT